MAKTANGQIETLSDLMLIIQQDMESLRNGNMDLAKGRVLNSYHKALLKGAELNLQYQRMKRGEQPSKELRLLALPDKDNAA